MSKDITELILAAEAPTSKEEMLDALIARPKPAAGTLHRTPGIEEGQLAAGIAHDVNNHLTCILGVLSVLERRIRQGRADEMLRYLAAAGAAARHAATLTQRLLNLAQRQSPKPMRVDVNGLLAALEDLLRITLGPDVSLEMVLAPGTWRALCDPSQLESAVINLAINARDAMPKGGRLVIRTGNYRLDEAGASAPDGEVESGDYVLLEVTDTGMGMLPEVIERVSEPFFTTKPPGQGTGLGLPMVRAFVEQCHGRFAIQSEPGYGTTVRIHLPRCGTEVPDDETRTGDASLTRLASAQATRDRAAGSRARVEPTISARCSLEA